MRCFILTGNKEEYTKEILLNTRCFSHSALAAFLQWSLINLQQQSHQDLFARRYPAFHPAASWWSITKFHHVQGISEVRWNSALTWVNIWNALDFTRVNVLSSTSSKLIIVNWTYILFIGKEASNSVTDEDGTTVCCAGLCIPLTSFASICKKYHLWDNFQMGNVFFLGNGKILTVQ